ncbi:hypothetical protein PENANT_c070G01807 [Penicillium antarcticum]|uniref:Uncharacterized protein n=1 Tax=Penicillium antarcticum TaxID=416450 RepID=A0A1V6PPS8_9EURO|nr:hypothetical protein PENANT_c070G01807 [Penicillium antarcticum]
MFTLAFNVAIPFLAQFATSSLQVLSFSTPCMQRIHLVHSFIGLEIKAHDSLTTGKSPQNALTSLSEGKLVRAEGILDYVVVVMRVENQLLLGWSVYAAPISTMAQ